MLKLDRVSKFYSQNGVVTSGWKALLNFAVLQNPLRFGDVF